MARKKRQNQNNGQGKPWKPFYKRVWFWVVVVLLIAGIGRLTGSGDDDTSSSSSNSSEVSSSAKKNSKKASSPASNSSSTSSTTSDSGKITREQFDAIKIGDLMNSGQGGDTLSALTAKFGKPESTDSSTTDNVQTDIVTWNNVVGTWGATVNVTFTNDNAVAKDLVGFKLTREQKISLSDFNGFANGMQYTDFTAKYGQPDYYNETLIAGTTTIIAGYTSGVAGGWGASFTVSFQNGALMSKSQSGMK